MHYLFDMDGVIVRSEPVMMGAAMELLEGYGISVKREEYGSYVGAGEAKLLEGILASRGFSYEPEMKDRLYEIYIRRAQSELQAFPNIKTVLSALKERGDKIALSSSADMVKIRANLAVVDIPMDWFCAIVSGEEAEQKKPDPEIFLKTAEKLGAEPSDCIVIEDALNGIRAAKAAGMKCAGFTSYFSREQLSAENPDFVIDDLMEILSLA
ncbi:MAG: HAD-IA family hydrolase [Clostridia bacterium]|nr:HAD-IA family hydrolase [Clostridia bacterium]